MDTEKLKELVAKGTPGPWRVDPINHGDVNGPDGRDVAVTLYAGMAALNVTGQEETLAAIPRDEAEANAALIVAAINALPSLLAELEAAREDAARYRWWRENIDHAMDDGLGGMAFESQLSHDIMEADSGVLMDAIADAAMQEQK